MAIIPKFPGFNNTSEVEFTYDKSSSNKNERRINLDNVFDNVPPTLSIQPKEITFSLSIEEVNRVLAHHLALAYNVKPSSISFAWQLQKTEFVSPEVTSVNAIIRPERG